MAIEFRHMTDGEIIQLAKQTSEEEILSKLPHYEILFILEKIDELVSTNPRAGKLYFRLMMLKIQILEKVLRAEAGLGV